MRTRLRKGRALCVRDVWFSEQHVLTTPRVRAKWMNTDRSHARVPHRTSRAASHASREARGVPSSVQGSGASRLARSPTCCRQKASAGGRRVAARPARSGVQRALLQRRLERRRLRLRRRRLPPRSQVASPRCSTSSARRSARYRSSAPPDVSMVVTQPLAGTGSTSQASHPGRRASSERRAGPSKPAGRTESIPRDPLSSGGQGGVGLSVTAVTKTASPCPVGSSQYAPHG